jgi:hypothetical protein
MDYYLSFADEYQARVVLYRENVPNYKNIDTVGAVYKNEQAVPGWHVNVRLVAGEDAEALEPFQITPATPQRVWA